MSVFVSTAYTPEHMMAVDRRMSTESSTSPPTTPVNTTINRITKSLKRKRPSGLSSALGGEATDAPKKKKASRACLNCQRAHLTCNDGRPCHRCIKKGIADSCTEGHRKKAKYLLEDDELETLKQTKQEANGTDSGTTGFRSSMETTSNEPVIHMNFDPTFTFGSEATNLEYTMLSAILGNTVDDQLLSISPPNYPSIGHAQPPAQQPTTPYQQSGTDSSSSWANGVPPRPPSSVCQPPETPIDLTLISPDIATPQPSLRSSSSYPQLQQPRPPFPRQTTSFADPNPQQPRQEYSALANDGPLSSARVEPSHPHGAPSPVTHSTSRISDIYRGTTRPFDYTQGYRFLMEYLQRNFDKNDMLRVVRALAIFRPSLIALQMSLTEEDETFVERCVQRSLIELEKLISFSGTPTVVWRRTGEICLVGMEFSMLTGWSQQELVGQGKYIYELFERQSLIEYWEKFSVNAFENATRSIYSHCVLLKPSGEPVPCAFCFSIRRDLFDLPSLIIGQWLPLLG